MLRSLVGSEMCIRDRILLEGCGSCGFRGETGRQCQILSRKRLGFVSNFTWNQEITHPVRIEWSPKLDGEYRPTVLKVRLMNVEEEDCVCYGFLDVSEFLSQQVHQACVSLPLERDGGVLETDLAADDMPLVKISLETRRIWDTTKEAVECRMRLFPHCITWHQQPDSGIAQAAIRVESSSGVSCTEHVPTSSSRGDQVTGFNFCSLSNPKPHEASLDVAMLPAATKRTGPKNQ
eukprot:TRINITY_DN12324_c0_g2_i1.p1 TRINITY_DN12324_c0_g2~~TRINITY_DN12324_c0_g2_i1.p1  ORF type:complete len:234 (+),score=56.03 TRINITY_DN12324_c0_g2_i1:148-849(+)